MNVTRQRRKLQLGTHDRARVGVRFPKDCYAPIVYKCIVIRNCYYQALAVSARVGTGTLARRFYDT